MTEFETSADIVFDDVGGSQLKRQLESAVSPLSIEGQIEQSGSPARQAVSGGGGGRASQRNRREHRWQRERNNILEDIVEAVRDIDGDGGGGLLGGVGGGATILAGAGGGLLSGAGAGAAGGLASRAAGGLRGAAGVAGRAAGPLGAAAGVQELTEPLAERFHEDVMGGWDIRDPLGFDDDQTIIEQLDRPDWLSDLTEYEFETPDWWSSLQGYEFETPDWWPSLQDYEFEVPDWWSNLRDFEFSRPDWIPSLTDLSFERPSWLPSLTDLEFGTPSWLSDLLSFELPRPGWLDRLDPRDDGPVFDPDIEPRYEPGQVATRDFSGPRYDSGSGGGSTEVNVGDNVLDVDVTGLDGVHDEIDRHAEEQHRELDQLQRQVNDLERDIARGR